MEAIIESVDEFYSENLAQEVVRGMREAASRGFWMNTNAPYGYRKVHVQDGAKKRPVLRLHPPADIIVRRIFSMALQGRSTLEITRVLNNEGIQSPRGKRWLKTTVHRMLGNEAYTGTLVWGTTAKDNTPPVRVEDAFPAIVSQREFKNVQRLLKSKAPKVTHPRRTASPYLLSGILTCQSCGKALSAAEAKGGRYTYYVCHSLLKRGSGECTTPRLNAKHFERLIVDQIRQHILTESNMRDLVKMVNEEMDSVIREQQERVEAADAELADIRRRMDRLWELVEKTDLTTEEILPRIRHHLDNQERLEQAADEARSILALRRANVQDVERIAAYAREMSDFLMESELTETKSFIRSFVKEITVRLGKAVIHYTIPTPLDNDIDGADVAEVALSRRVMKSVASCTPRAPLMIGLPFLVVSFARAVHLPLLPARHPVRLHELPLVWKRVQLSAVTSCAWTPQPSILKVLPTGKSPAWTNRGTPAMTTARRGEPKAQADGNGAITGYEAELWRMADAEYKHVVLGLIFLKYISDAFQETHAQLEAEVDDGADPEDPDEYRAQGVFWVPPEARWPYLQAQASVLNRKSIL